MMHRGRFGVRSGGGPYAFEEPLSKCRRQREVGHVGSCRSRVLGPDKRKSRSAPRPWPELRFREMPTGLADGLGLGSVLWRDGQFAPGAACAPVGPPLPANGAGTRLSQDATLMRVMCQGGKTSRAKRLQLKSFNASDRASRSRRSAPQRPGAAGRDTGRGRGRESLLPSCFAPLYLSAWHATFVTEQNVASGFSVRSVRL